MYYYLKGTFAHIDPSYVVMDVSGIGYEIQISLHTYELIKNDKDGLLYIHFQVKEDAHALFGFYDKFEKQVFKHLISISGVGTNTARLILSALSAREVVNIINMEQVKALEKVKGIGAKTAQRIVLELKGKMHYEGTSSANLQSPASHNTNKEDALLALVNLGINKAIAQNAINKSQLDDQTAVEEIIKEALKNL